MKIYTRSGDEGKTSLYDQTRVDKDSIRVESYGTVDELNSALGLARSYIKDKDMKKIIKEIQRELFDVAGELATKEKNRFPEKIKETHVKNLESIVDEYINKMDEKELKKFIIPGSNQVSAALHLARTICRRAERRLITLSKEEEIRSILIKYINRLSDVIYALARYSESQISYVEFKGEKED